MPRCSMCCMEKPVEAFPACLLDSEYPTPYRQPCHVCLADITTNFRFENRFWGSVPHRPPNGCWPWAEKVDKDGYGIFRYKGRLYRAQRLAYILHHGGLDPALVVRHSCDTRLCIQWLHLIAGTQRENVQDAMDRDRIQKGARHYQAKLTEALVRQIIALRDTHSQATLATMFGVSDTTINAILRGKLWTHADPSYVPSPEQYTQSGASHHLAKMTPGTVQQIRALSLTHSLGQLGSLFHLDRSTVHDIVHHDTWKDVPGTAPSAQELADAATHRTRGAGHYATHLTEEDVRTMRALRLTRTLAELATQFGISVKAVSLICLGKRWKHVHS